MPSWPLPRGAAGGRDQQGRRERSRFPSFSEVDDHLTTMSKPTPVSERTQSVMRGNRAESEPERALRSVLHRRGLRFRKHASPISGLRCRPDVVFSEVRVVVFVDGCFWHRCPDHYRPSRQNGDWWDAKIARNVARDLEQNRLLSEAGWLVLRVWEHEAVEVAADRVVKAVIERRNTACASDPHDKVCVRPQTP
jgi:DNA mismatch endonuclease (patch repair protein)